MTGSLSISTARLLFEARSFGRPDIDATLRALGLHGREFLLLTLIGAKDDVSEQVLGVRLGVARSRITQITAKLSAGELVTRTGNERSIHGYRLRITPAGLEVHERAVDAIWRGQDGFAEPLDPSTREALRRFIAARAATPMDN